MRIHICPLDLADKNGCFGRITCHTCHTSHTDICHTNHTCHTNHISTVKPVSKQGSPPASGDTSRSEIVKERFRRALDAGCQGQKSPYPQSSCIWRQGEAEREKHLRETKVTSVAQIGELRCALAAEKVWNGRASRTKESV
jgi:hypothetical protein